MIVLVASLAVLGTIVGLYMIYQGLINGITRKKIQIHNRQQFATGAQAIARGSVLLGLGVFFLVMSLFVCWDLISSGAH